MTGHEFKKKSFAFSLFVIFLPFLFAFDGKFETREALAMLTAYLILAYFIEKKQNFFHKVESGLFKKTRGEITDFILIVLGATAIFAGAHILVLNTKIVASTLGISPFLISILLLSLGTDLPETTIAIVSVFKKAKSLAMGDYLGSAAANTLLFGLITIVGGEFSFFDPTFLWTYLAFASGLILFFLFAKTKGKLSRAEGLGLLLLYAMFITFKII